MTTQTTDPRDAAEIASGDDGQILAVGSAIAGCILGLGILAVGCIFGGCANTPSGLKVVASSASYTNVGDINWDEYKIPVLSLYLGPKATVWAHKDFKVLDEIEMVGTVTNSTSALGVYDSDEEKHLTLRLRFRGGSITNATNEVVK